MSFWTNNKSSVMYSLSIIPLGSSGTGCNSYDSCAKMTGMKGFDVPVLIYPIAPVTKRCKPVECRKAGCPGAFNFPGDDISKVLMCPSSTKFYVIYCP